MIVDALNFRTVIPQNKLVMDLGILTDAFSDAALDALKALPFLILAFCFMEYVERREEGSIVELLRRSGKIGPLVGSLAGLVPQCGFSAAIANLYAGGIVSIGTLVAVFLSTSDEAVILMLSDPDSIRLIPGLLLTKFCIAVFFGYATDRLLRKRENPAGMGDICTGCGRDEAGGILLAALRHTAGVFAWLLIVEWILNTLLVTIGTEGLTKLLLNGYFFQPLLTALIGLIPNCAVSVLLARLYITGSLSFAAAAAGLSSGAGVGLIVLFRISKNKKDALFVTVLLYVSAALSGLILSIF